jgi:hypothetical protein
MKQNGLAVAGGLVSAGAGALAGCCLGIPVALVFTVIIVVVANMSGGGPKRLQGPPVDYDDYDDDVSRALPQADRKRRRPVRREEERPAAADRRREADDDWRRRAEDDEHYRERGFRPRRRGEDG